MSQVHLKLPLRVDVSFFQSQVSLCKKWYPEEKTRPAKKVVCTRFPGLTRNPSPPFFSLQSTLDRVPSPDPHRGQSHWMARRTRRLQQQ